MHKTYWYQTTELCTFSANDEAYNLIYRRHLTILIAP